MMPLKTILYCPKRFYCILPEQNPLIQQITRIIHPQSHLCHLVILFVNSRKDKNIRTCSIRGKISCRLGKKKTRVA